MPKTSAKTSRKLNLAPGKIIDLLSKIKTTYVLGFLLVICAFLIGVLYTKISYLEKGGATGGLGTNAEVSPPPAGYSLGEKVDLGKDSLPVLGKENAKVKITEFSDFQCPFCERFFSQNLEQLKKDYIDTGKVQLVYRHFPLTSIHPNAQKSAEAAQCADKQGNFWDYHDELFAKQSEWSNLDAASALEKFVEYANSLGLNGEELRSCVSNDEMKEIVAKDMEAGSAAGVNGTPTTYLNGKMIQVGGGSAGALPYEELKKLIDEALK